MCTWKTCDDDIDNLAETAVEMVTSLYRVYKERNIATTIIIDSDSDTEINSPSKRARSVPNPNPVHYDSDDSELFGFANAADVVEELDIDELESYMRLSQVRTTEDYCPLTWWSNNKKKYPTLYKMAMDVLAAPASSVASESVFSSAKRIMGDLQHSMHTSTYTNRL